MGNLLVALEADNLRLGRLVRGTAGIDPWLTLCPDDAQVGNWYIRVLRACPNVQQVNLRFATVTELELLLRILHLSPPATKTSSSQNTRCSSIERPQVHSITFDQPSWDSEPLDLSHIFAILGRAFVPSLITVRFDHIERYFNIPHNPIPLFPFPIKHIRIDTVGSSLAETIALFPRSPSTLESFSFSTSILDEKIDLAPLSNLDGNHLRKLELEFSKISRCCEFILSKYSISKRHLLLVNEGLDSYPLLTSLTLSGTHGPSLLFLSMLARSSPLLRILDLGTSLWISDSDPLSTIPDEIFPETRVLSELEQLKHLEDVHLGVLPTIDQDRYGTLVKSLESRGVKVRFDCCVEDEETESE